MNPPSRHFNRIFIIAAWAIAASWANHGHADAPDGHYTLNSETVYDTKTKLTWERPISAGMVTWADATTYCANLKVENRAWRVPSMKELQTIVDRTREKPAIDPKAFPDTPNTQITPFWTSSPWAKAPATATWIVDFAVGSSSYIGVDIANLAHVRCVS